MSSEDSSTSGGGGGDSDVRDKLAHNAQKLLRSMKQLLAREKTLTITSPSNKGGKTGRFSCTDVVATTAGFGGLPGATPIRVHKRDPDRQQANQNNLQLLSQ